MPRNNWSFSKTGGQANRIERIRAERLADLKDCFWVVAPRAS